MALAAEIGIAAAYDTVGKKIKTYKTKVFHVLKNPVQCSLEVGKGIIEAGGKVQVSWSCIQKR